jgi:hypothetical protein
MKHKHQTELPIVFAFTFGLFAGSADAASRVAYSWLTGWLI